MTSLARPLLRAALKGANAILPESLAAFLGRAGFQAYRNVLRAFYYRRVLYGTLMRDHESAEKHFTIFRIMPYSLVGTGGLDATYDALESLEKERTQGAVVECGVAQGGCAAMMCLQIRKRGSGRPVWLFDSFEGLPAPGEKDYVDGRTGDHIRELPRGSCLGTLEEVSGLLFERLSLDRERIKLVQGWFDQTLPASAGEIGAIALLRIDADWYDSVKICLDILYPQVVSGGWIIIDDYGTCFGAKKAVDEFRASHEICTPMVFDGRGGALFRKS